MAQQPQQPDQQSHRQPDEDIFSVVGGCELGSDVRQQQQHPLHHAMRNASTNSLGSAAGLPNSSSVGNLSRMGDLPEEQPSRILFLRGLDATVSDEALVQMFEVAHYLHDTWLTCLALHGHRHCCCEWSAHSLSFQCGHGLVIDGVYAKLTYNLVSHSEHVPSRKIIRSSQADRSCIASGLCRH